MQQIKWKVLQLLSYGIYRGLLVLSYVKIDSKSTLYRVGCSRRLGSKEVTARGPFRVTRHLCTWNGLEQAICRCISHKPKQASFQ